MAKKQKAPPGVAQLSEKEFSELVSKRNPKSKTLDKVLEKLAAQNANTKASSPEFVGVRSTSAMGSVQAPESAVTPEAIETESKAQVIEKNVAKQEESRMLKETAATNEKILKADDNIVKGDKKLIEVEKKLTSTIEKLVSALQKSSGLGTGPIAPSARAQELADSRKLDYRTYGQRIKDKIYGVGGNKFDPNSLRYKFGTLKGLAETTGLVKRGSGSALESKLAVREEEMQTAESVAKLRGEDTEKGKAYYLGKAKESTVAKRELQAAEEQIKIHRNAGLSDEEIQATKEGKKLFQARDLAASKVISTDPKMKSEKAGLLGTKNEVTRFAGPAVSSDSSASISSPDTTEKESESGRVVGEQTDLLRKIEKNTRKGKSGLGEDGDKKEGVLSKLMDTLGDLALFSAGGRMLRGAGAGLAKGASKLFKGAKSGIAKGASAAAKGAKGAAPGAAKGLGKISQFAAKNAGKLKVGGGLLSGGIAAYEGYSDYKEASEAEKTGKITSSEADIKKTGAVTGAAGGLSGAAAGAVAGSVAGPIGTVVGAAIGGIAGSKLGKSIGEWGASTWKNLTGKGKDQAKPAAAPASTESSMKSTEQHEMHIEGIGTNNPKYIIDGQEVSQEDYSNVASMRTGWGKVEAMKNVKPLQQQNADKVAQASAQNDSMKYTTNKQGDQTLVNAPTNINKVTQTSVTKRPARSPDWYENRHRYKGMVPNVSF